MRVKIDYWAEEDLLTFVNEDFEQQGILIGDDEDDKYVKDVWVIRFTDEVTSKTQGYQILGFWKNREKLKGKNLPGFYFPKIYDEAIDMIENKIYEKTLEVKNMIWNFLENYEERKEIADYIGDECLEWNFTGSNGRIIKKLPFTDKEWEEAYKTFTTPELNAMMQKWMLNYFFRVAMEDFWIISDNGKLSAEDAAFVTKPEEVLDDDELRARWIDYRISDLSEMFRLKDGDNEKKYDAVTEIEDLVAGFDKTEQKTFNEILVRQFLLENHFKNGQYQKVIEEAKELINDVDKMKTSKRIELKKILLRHRYMIALSETGRDREAFEVALEIDKLLEKHVKKIKEDELGDEYWKIKNDAILVIKRIDSAIGIERFKKLAGRVEKQALVDPILKGVILTNYAECIVEKYGQNENKDDEAHIKDAIKIAEKGKKYMNSVLEKYANDRNYFWTLLCLANACCCLKKTKANKAKTLDYATEASAILDNLLFDVEEFERYRRELNWYFLDYNRSENSGEDKKVCRMKKC